MMTKREQELINIAEQHVDDVIANEAMKKLREEFDSSYKWCEDCDGMVVMERNCCMNQPPVNEDEIGPLPF